MSTSWVENLLTGDFNPGTPAGQTIVLENIRGISKDDWLVMTNIQSTKIMEFLSIKEHIMGEVITYVPTT